MGRARAGAAAAAPELRHAEVRTPIGTFRIGYDGRQVAYVDLREPRSVRTGPAPEGPVERGPFPKGSPPHQLQEYFSGKRHEFEVDLAFLQGSEFDRKVWYGLQQIPFGTYRSYSEVARRLGRPNSARAVGGAAGRNPIPIIVPCHRLVGANRSLTGFGMGLWRKRWLLTHEGTYPIPPAPGAATGPGRQATLEESLRGGAHAHPASR